MKNKGTIVVLGGNLPHANLVKILNARGYRTVLIDYLDAPVAKQYADIHYQESTLDMEAVERIARAENACRIMEICTDRALPPAAYVAEKMALPHPMSYEASLLVTNKNRMKRFMLDNGIPTSKFFPVSDISQLEGIELSYPLMVKPADSSGSIGITRVEIKPELESAVLNAIAKSGSGQAIVEEYVSGPEIQIDCFVTEGKAVILDIKRKRKHTEDAFTLPYGSIIPAGESRCAREKINSICCSLVNGLKLKNGPLYIQAIMKGDDISVIEFGVRFGGGLSFKILKDVAGIDIVECTADAYLGGKPEIRDSFNDFKGVYATYHVFPKAGVFSHFAGCDQLLAEGVFQYFSISMKEGTVCNGDMASKERAAAFILQSADMAENDAKLKHIIDTLDIVDVDGRSMMRKDIYGL